MTTARPFVLINMAMSADGKIAPPHRRFVPIGSRRDHDNLLRLRATHDRVRSGAQSKQVVVVASTANRDKASMRWRDFPIGRHCHVDQH